jgi:hypothetical protein
MSELGSRNSNTKDVMQDGQNLQSKVKLVTDKNCIKLKSSVMQIKKAKSSSIIIAVKVWRK